MRIPTPRPLNVNSSTRHLPMRSFQVPKLMSTGACSRSAFTLLTPATCLILVTTLSSKNQDGMIPYTEISPSEALTSSSARDKSGHKTNAAHTRCQSKIEKGLFRRRRHLVIRQMHRFQDQTFCCGHTHPSQIHDQIISVRVAPVDAKQRHEPATAGLVHCFDMTARCCSGEFFSHLNLAAPHFNRRSQKDFYNVLDIG